MFQILSKIFFIIVISLIVSNCSNTKIIKISDDIKRIDKFNSEGNYQKSYYMKYNKEFTQWFPANCYNNVCEYTSLALIQIKNLSKDDQEQSVDNQQEQAGDNQQEQAGDNQQEQAGDNQQEQSGDNQQEQSLDNQEENLEIPKIEVPL